MAKWSDLATWRGPTSNQGGGMVEVRGVVLHIAEGSYEGTISWQKNPSSDVSSHFVKGKADGEEAQIVDTDTTAWTQAAGNGHWLSIENAGFVPDKLTASQVEFAAQVLAKAHKVYGVPLQVTSSPDGRGLGHHSMGAPAWGHSQCPGSNIINQKPAIVARAKEIVEGDVSLTTDQTRDAVWRRDDAVDNEFPWRPDSPEHNPPGTNPKVQGQTAILEAAGRANLAYETAQKALDILEQGVPVPGLVNLTPESVAAVAEAVAEKLAARLEE
jgi:hypothetical protein